MADYRWITQYADGREAWSPRSYPTAEVAMRAAEAQSCGPDIHEVRVMVPGEGDAPGRVLVTFPHLANTQHFVVASLVTAHSERTLSLDVVNNISISLREHLHAANDSYDARIMLSLAELRWAVALLEAAGVEEGAVPAVREPSA